MGTSWKGRNARLARMGVKVGGTYASHRRAQNVRVNEAPR